MIKTQSKLRFNDIAETKKRLGHRELSATELKLVSGGLVTEGGTCSQCGDCDC